MAIPPKLRDRANFIFSSFGGVYEAEKLLTDNQIIDISLFNGYTIVVVPTFTGKIVGQSAFNEDFNDDFDIARGIRFLPEEGYDLEEVGYYPNIQYFLLDENYKFIHTDIIEKTEYQGEEGYFFGFTEKERIFLYTAKHGGRYFLSFKNHLGPQLVQILVNKNRIDLEYNSVLEEWRKQADEYVAQDSNYNEALIYFPDKKYKYTVHVLVSPLRSAYKEREIAKDAKQYNLEYLAGQTLYLNIKEPTWMSIRHYVYGDYHPATNNLQFTEFVDSYNTLIAAGFYSPDITLISPNDIVSDKVTFFKTYPSGYTEELIVYTNELRRIYLTESKKYKPLILENIRGKNINKAIVLPDRAVFLQTDVRENISALGYSGRLGQKVLTTFKKPDRFKIYADVESIDYTPDNI